ncbi:MAG: YqjK family protein [Burkholderiaceae bacterium]
MTGAAALPRAQAAALALRREALLGRSAALRARLAEQSRVLAAPLSLADEAVGAWHWLRRHPALPLAALGVLVVMKPRRAWRVAARSWWLWRGLRWAAALTSR